MAILNIIQYPDLRLKRKSTDVSDIKTPRIQKIISSMFVTLANTENCAALAATQLDIGNPPSIVVFNSLEEDMPPYCLINPKIIKQSGSEIAKEGCMSILIDDISAEVKRATEVTVTALDINGQKLEFIAQDFFARCLQHECDHLQGIIYLDRISKLKRSLIDKKIKKLTNL
jgi:peptide deformylase